MTAFQWIHECEQDSLKVRQVYVRADPSTPVRVCSLCGEPYTIMKTWDNRMVISELSKPEVWE